MGDDSERASLFDFIINRGHKNFQMLYEFHLKDFLNPELILFSFRTKLYLTYARASVSNTTYAIASPASSDRLK